MFFSGIDGDINIIIAAFVHIIQKELANYPKNYIFAIV